MKLHELNPAKGGATKKSKRLGRGYGSGQGGHAGRGLGGQNSRSSGGVRPGFEGGQMPLFRSLPKRGFNNKFAKPMAIVNLRDLNRFEDGETVNAESLIAKGLVRPSELKYGLKVLGKGELDKKLTVQANKFSGQAKDQIEAAGGKAEVV